jgi:hypothetical protein
MFIAIGVFRWRGIKSFSRPIPKATMLGITFCTTIRISEFMLPMAQRVRYDPLSSGLAEMLSSEPE